MKNLYLALTFILCTNNVVAQTDTTLSKQDKSRLDSMLNTDEFLSMFDDSARSYFDVSLGFGNGTFSTQNQAVNATGFTNQLVLTPALFYFFKSGFNLGVTGFLTNKSSQLKLYQTGASIGYDFSTKNIATGISYTRYFGDNNTYSGSSIYQNEAFGYLKYTKPFIQPGISIGYANGKYKSADFVSFPFKYRLLNPIRDTTVIVKGIDSTINTTSYFSITLSAEHTFEFENIFTQSDGLTISSIFMLNAGSDKFTENHTNNLFTNRPRLAARFSSKKKIAQANKMQLQSIASSINITYGIGKFYVQPNVYFDYYLPETTGQRFSSIVSLTAGFTF